MANQIQIIRSGTAGAQPNASELELGELALNYADGKLFYKDDSNNIQVLNDTSSNSGNKLVVHPTETKIGIGTSSPEYALDIGGSTGNTSNTLRINQQSGGTAIRIGTGSATSDTTILRVDGGELDSPTLYGGESDKSNDGFSINYDGTGSDEANYLQIYADNQGNASQNLALSISQSGAIGINTNPSANPSDQKLEVDGKVKILSEDTIFTNGPTNAPLHILQTSVGDSPTGDGHAIGFDANEIQSSTNLTIRVGYGKSLSFGNVNSPANIAAGQSYNVTRMTIKDDGDIGVGNTSPNAKLDVTGDIKSSVEVITPIVRGPEVADSLTLRADPQSPDMEDGTGGDFGDGGAQISLHSSDSSVPNQIYVKSAFTYFQNVNDDIVASIAPTSTPSVTTDLTPKSYVDQAGIPNIVQAISSKRIGSSADLPDTETATLVSSLWPANELKDATSSRTWANINKYPLYASITARRSNSMFRMTVNAFAGVEGNDGCGVIVSYNTGAYSHGTAPTGLAETVVGDDEGTAFYRNLTFKVANLDDGSDSYIGSGHWNGLWTPSSGITAGTTVNFFLSLVAINDDDDKITFNHAFTAAGNTHKQGVYPTNIMIEEIFTQ